jgi:hypothetical protein
MKLTLLVLVLAASAASTFAQGTLNYNNYVSGTQRSPIFGPDINDPHRIQIGQPLTGGTNLGNATPTALATAGGQQYTGLPLSGTGFSGELWADNNGTLQAVTGSLTTFRSGATAGSINAIATLPVPQIPLNGQGTVQFRAWDNQGGTVLTWAAVLANNSILRGMSLPFSVTAGGGGVPPNPPGNLVGLTSFNLFTPVPEPSLIALGALGLGALLLRRKKA